MQSAKGCEEWGIGPCGEVDPLRNGKETADTTGAGKVETPAPTARARAREREREIELWMKIMNLDSLNLTRAPLGAGALKEGAVVAIGRWPPRKNRVAGKWRHEQKPPKEGNGDTPLGYSGRIALRREQCNGFAQGIANQRLDKHTSTE
jgi:hypothetical protein